MKKRVALLGCSHETNTFSPILTRYEDFADSNLWRGREMEEAFRNSRAVLAGFFQAAIECVFDPLPLMFTRAEPLGVIAQDAADRIAEELVDSLAANGPWDGVLLALHGAAVSATEQDFDGWLLSQVRETVGSDVPIGVVYDLHANVSQRMIDDCDIAVFYRTNPHLDALERGLECGRLLARTMNGEIRPTQTMVKPPLIIGITRSDTSEEPLQSLLAEMEEILNQPRMLSASIIEGFPWADVPEMGMAFIVVTDNDPDLAVRQAEKMARSAWEQRFAMISEALSPEDAIRKAEHADKTPVGILDIGDNIGGGGSGESTILLTLALEACIPGVLSTIYDPEAVNLCVRAGVGASISLPIGAKLDTSFCSPLEASGHVRLISDGKFEDTAVTHEGYRFFDSGPTVVLELDNEVTVVLTSRRIGNVSQMQFRSLGIDPAAKRIIILKGVNAPRGAYRDICSILLLADTRGSTSANLPTFTYKNRPSPLFPFEADIEF